MATDQVHRCQFEIDKRTDRVIGTHVVGHADEELIHIIALVIKHGITAGDLGDLVYGFPTFSADIKSML
jgi:glutathione reductase (NADPH)